MKPRLPQDIQPRTSRCGPTARRFELFCGRAAKPTPSFSLNCSPAWTRRLKRARKRPEVPTAATDQDNAKLAEQTPGALIGISLAQIAAENRKLYLVPLDGVEPSLANFESGAYSLAKKEEEVFVVPTKSRPEAQRIREISSSRRRASRRCTNSAILPGAD